MIQKFLLCQLALLKLIYISSHVIIFCWWKLITTLFFSMHIFLIMASLCLKIIHRSFLFVHRKIFLAQILYSWFMIIRLYHFLNTSWKRSLLLRFFDFLSWLSIFLVRGFAGKFFKKYSKISDLTNCFFKILMLVGLCPWVSW